MDLFFYTITDGNNGYAVGRITINVGHTSALPAPAARHDTASTLANTAVTIDVLSNDVNSDGDMLELTAVSAPVYRTITPNQDGTITYMPLLDFVGLDSFGYQYLTAKEALPQRTINVTAPPVATFDSSITTVVAMDDMAMTTRGSAVQLAVLKKASGDALTVVSVTEQLHMCP